LGEVEKFPLFSGSTRGGLLIRKFRKLLADSMAEATGDPTDSDPTHKPKKVAGKPNCDYLPRNFKNGNRVELKFYLEAIETRLELGVDPNKVSSATKVGKMYQKFTTIFQESKSITPAAIKKFVSSCFHSSKPQPPKRSVY
jgi:hypothetical protein